MWEFKKYEYKYTINLLVFYKLCYITSFHLHWNKEIIIFEASIFFIFIQSFRYDHLLSNSNFNNFGNYWYSFWHHKSLQLNCESYYFFGNCFFLNKNVNFCERLWKHCLFTQTLHISIVWYEIFFILISMDNTCFLLFRYELFTFLNTIFIYLLNLLNCLLIISN